jgi:hypothetical protein
LRHRVPDLSAMLQRQGRATKMRVPLLRAIRASM